MVNCSRKCSVLLINGSVLHFTWHDLSSKGWVCSLHHTHLMNSWAAWIAELPIWSLCKDDSGLDTLINVEQNIFITIVYSKPGDKTAFLLPSSQHPRHAISNFLPLLWKTLLSCMQIVGFFRLSYWKLNRKLWKGTINGFSIWKPVAL